MNAACKLYCASDEQLIVDLRRALDDERSRLVEFLRILGEVDARRLYVPMGFSSLFNFCVEGLRLSPDQAFRRAATARVGRRFPMVWPMLADGTLHMSGVTLLAKHLDTHGEALLTAARDKSKVEIEAMVSKLDGAETPRVTVRITVSAEAEALWRRARALSGGEAGAVFEEAIADFVERLETKKFKTTKHPRATPTKDAPAGRRPIAAAVKRAVTERDGRRCTFVSDDGRRCDETCRLEFDHILPVARGGRSTVDNVRLRCRAHNQLEAERIFGHAFMARKRSTLPRPSAERPSEASRRAGSSGPGAERSSRAPRRASTWSGPSVSEGHSSEASPRVRRPFADVDPAPGRPERRVEADDARLALRSLDFSAREARRLLEAVRATVGPRAPAERWVRAALRAHHAGALDGAA